MWPRCLSRGLTVARLLGLQVRIPQEAWMPVSFECCLLSDRGLWDGQNNSPTKCVCVCDRGTSQKRPRPTIGCCDMWGGGENAIIAAYIYIYDCHIKFWILYVKWQ